VTATAAGADVLVRQLGLVDDIVDVATLSRAVDRFRSHGITLPTFAELADPHRIDPAHTAAVDPDAPHAGNLFRVHWHNDGAGRRVEVPDHLVVPPALTGVDAPIVVVFGDRFPMIGAHKVLAAYACLAPRVVSGQFDPTRHRAVWPSTGNYARGGVAISRIMGCRGVAVLPAGMSRERFDWLDRWVADPGDIIRTPGSESNVKEIYDACHELAREPANIVFNQFSELANHLAHVAVTAPALERVFDRVREGTRWRLAAFVSATGSAGTIAAGDVLKERYGSRIVAVEALECPTMLENGFGEHNIQGIGDKHIPLIHNVMNTDVICAISDESTDELDVLFNTEAGRAYLAKRRGLDDDTLGALRHLGLSSICNVLAAIKTARLLDLGADDAIVTVATDGGAMYASGRVKTLADRWPDGFGELEAAEVFGRRLGHVDSGDMIECTERDRNRIFNLGYYTWVEQQGTPIDVFEARRAPSFWTGLRRYVDVWDALIDDFNGRVAAGS
jgi:cysteine synthase